MVRDTPEGSEQKLFSAWLLAAAARFDGHENSVHLGEGFGVIELEHPTFVGFVIKIEDSHV